MISTGLVEIVDHSDATAAAEAVAAEAAAWLGICSRAGGATVALPGGRSPALLLRLLAHEPLDWQLITATSTDERKVPVDHELSNARMIRDTFVGTPAAMMRFVPLRGAIAVQHLSTPLDLVVLGMGEDGHIASLFPGQPLDRPGLPPVIEVVPDPLPAEAPVARWTWSLSALAGARRTLLVIKGERKRRVVEEALDTSRLTPVSELLRRACGPVTIHWAAE